MAGLIPTAWFAVVALVQAPAPQAPAPQAPAPQAPSPRAVREPVTGTVVDPDGKPVAGAVVELWRTEGLDLSVLDLAYRNDHRLLTRVRTTGNGVFGLQAPRGLRCQLRVDAGAYAHWCSDAVDFAAPMQVRLQAPATLTGRIVLPDGSGTPAQLKAWNPDGLTVLETGTDAEGRFRCERLPAGQVTLRVGPASASAPEWAQLTLVAGETVERTVACKPGEVLRGRVLDAATGQPIAGARVGEGWVVDRAVAADRDGNYTLPGFGSDGYDDVHCTADGYVRAVQLAKKIPAGSPRQHDFRLERGNAVTGLVVTPAGAPLAGAYVAAAGTVHDGVDQYHYWVAGRTDAAGRFRLQGVRPDLPPTLLVRCDGLATLVYHLAAAKDGVHDAGRIDMRAARCARGQVLDADGKPLAHAHVYLHGTNADRTRLADLPAPRGGMGGWSLLRSYLGVHEAFTDAGGHFAFGDLAAGDYQVAVERLRQAREQDVVEFVVRAGEDPAPVVVQLAN